VALARRAAARGLTHLAVTDHHTLEGAFRAAEAAPPGLVVIVGCEVNAREGDLILLFVERALPAGLAAREVIAAGREQGALVGVPHPFDRGRRSLLLDPSNEALVGLVDWIESMNGRVARQAANDQAASLASRLGVPGIGVSDAHTLIEVGTTHTVMTGDPGTKAGLLAALREPLSIAGADATVPRRSPFDRLFHRGQGPVGSAR
jgi:predicted metal-dependent phosphoesterase TrpH